MNVINEYTQKIGITDNSDFKDYGVIGNDCLFQRWESVSAAIKRCIDEQYRFFFARPDYNENENKITWYTRPWHDDVPQIIGRLDSEGANHYKEIFNQTLQYYKDVVSNLSKSSDDYKILSRIIKGMDEPKYIDNFVFAFDDRVVCVAWGMSISDRSKGRIDSIIIDAPKPLKKNPKTEKEPENTQERTAPIEQTVPDPPISYTILFNAGEHGSIVGTDSYTKVAHSVITENEIPRIKPNDGYEFTGWNVQPTGHEVDGDKTFVAQYREKQSVVPPIPWYTRFWNWLTGILTAFWLWFKNHGWKWLLGLLLLLLLLFLLQKCGHCNGGLLNGCTNNGAGHERASVINEGDTPWINGDPYAQPGKGGIYDPNDPYKDAPSPVYPGSDYEDIAPSLPDQPNKLTPIEGEPEVIPGNPTIIANRLNLLMENESKSILDLCQAFKEQYPSEQYKIVYYDDVVKRMQIEFPTEEREHLKETLPSQFSEYQVFVFDEALFEGAYTPNDPAVNNEQSWYLKAINAYSAWDYTQGEENITVAIVDNGFNLSHPEFKGKIRRAYNVWTHDANVYPQEIDHGTHVAGLAIGTADNQKGISGIAPKCTFMPIQVADRRGLMTTTSVLDGIIYALYQGADVINVSLGEQFSGLDNYPQSLQRELINNHFKEEERLWREVMRIAQKHNNATIVVAAGNDNVLAGIEALQRPELFIVVSAIDKNNTPLHKADFSNYGEYSTISAPGVDIYSTYKSGYQSLDGTSMAAPIVTGAVALMKSLNHDLTTQQIICTLQSTGETVRDDIGNLLLLDKALEKVKSGTIDDCTPEPSTGDVQILLSWNNYNDLDLLCIDPYNDLVCFRQKRVPSGGQLEIDMNVNDHQSNQPIENIYWPQNGAPQGTYTVGLLYYCQHEQNINNTPYKIIVKYGGKEEIYQGTIQYDPTKTPIEICSFTLGNSDNAAGISNDNPNRNAERLRTRQQLEQRRAELQQEIDNINHQLRNL